MKCKETFTITFLRLVDFGPNISSRRKEECKGNIQEERNYIPEGKKVFIHVKMNGRGRKK
jgi:hypothetical protein